MEKRKEHPSQTTSTTLTTTKESASAHGFLHSKPPDVRRYRDALYRLGYMSPGRGNAKISFSVEQDAVFVEKLLKANFDMTKLTETVDGDMLQACDRVDREVGFPSARTTALRRAQLDRIQGGLDALTKTLGKFRASVILHERALLEAATAVVRNRAPPQPRPMDLLPDELVLALLRWFTPVATTAMACTCRRMASLASDGQMWRRKFLRYMRMAYAQKLIETKAGEMTENFCLGLSDAYLLQHIVKQLSLAVLYLPDDGDEYRRTHPDATAAFWREVCLRLYALRWTGKCGLCRENPQNSYHPHHYHSGWLTDQGWRYKDAMSPSLGTAAVTFYRWWHEQVISSACPYCQTTMLISMRDLINECNLLVGHQFISHSSIGVAMGLRVLVDGHTAYARERYFMEDVMAAILQHRGLLRYVPRFVRSFEPEDLLPSVDAHFGFRSSVWQNRSYARVGLSATPSQDGVSRTPTDAYNCLFLTAEEEEEEQKLYPRKKQKTQGEEKETRFADPYPSASGGIISRND